MHYPLHIIHRFNLEKKLIEDENLINYLPDLWNSEFKKIFNLEVNSDNNGCLQDIHWFSGDFGYFPTYLVGAMIAAQLKHTLDNDIPEINDFIKYGNLKIITKWLKKIFILLVIVYLLMNFLKKFLVKNLMFIFIKIILKKIFKLKFLKNNPKYRELFDFLRPFLWEKLSNKFKLRLITCILLLVFAKIATLITPIILGKTIDSLTLLNNDINITILLIFGLIISYGSAKVLSLAFNEIKDSFFSTISQSATREIGLIVFKHLHNLPLDFHLKRNTGSLSRFIDRGTKGIDFLLRYVVFNVIPIVVEIMFVCIIFSYLFGVNYTLITILTVSFYVFATLKITQWRIKFRKKLNYADNSISNTMLESLINFETVKYFGNQNFEFKRLDSFLKKYEYFANKNRSSLSILNITQNVIIMIGITFLMVMSSLSVEKNLLTVGGFVIINTYLLQLYQPLNFLGSVYREIRQSIVDMENMFSLIKIENKKKKYFKNEKSNNNHIIEFKNVSFCYEKKK